LSIDTRTVDVDARLDERDRARTKMYYSSWPVSVVVRRRIVSAKHDSNLLELLPYSSSYVDDEVEQLMLFNDSRVVESG